MSTSFFRPASLLALTALAVAACSNDGPPTAAAAPVPGDFGPTPTSTGESAELPGPRADDPEGPSAAERAKSMRKGAKPRDAKGDKGGPPPMDPANMDPSTFVPKAYCLMPKLSMCSVYGSKYERLGSVNGFCAALGGEQAASCPKDGQVARCITPANVITSYYSTGQKPYTKETAEQKCNEKNWMVLPD